MKYLKMTIIALLLLTAVHATTQTKKYLTCMIHDRAQGIKFNYYYTDCGTFKMDILLVDVKYLKVLNDNTFLWHGAMIPMETLEELDKKVKLYKLTK